MHDFGLELVPGGGFTIMHPDLGLIKDSSSAK